MLKMHTNSFAICIIPLLLISCYQSKQSCNYPAEITGIGLVVKTELGFFQKKYKNYFEKRINVDKLTEEESSYSNKLYFDEKYKFVKITMRMLYIDSKGRTADTINLIYPVFLNSNQKSTDIVFLNSYVFCATLMTDEMIKESTLEDEHCYFVEKSWKMQPIKYPVRNYHLRFKDNSLLKNTVDSLLLIVKTDV